MAAAVKGRRYDSPVRKEQAERTRQRIVRAAQELFESQGYGPTTIKEIAEKAAVAVDTVYAIFGTKARVLTAWMDARLSGPHAVANVTEVPEALAIRDARTHRAQIKAFVGFVAAVSERVWAVNEVMRSAAAVDPQMAAIYDEMHGYRLKNMAVIASWLTARGPLRVDEAQAAETIWALASPELGTMLTTSRGWTKARYLEWLEDTLVRVLLRGSR